MDAIQIISDSVYSNGFNQLIFLLAVINAVFMYKAYDYIKKLKAALFDGDSVLERFIKERIGTPEEVESKIKLEFSKWEEMYKASTKWFHLFTSMIAVFPLMGIGGTVLGIIPTLLDFSQVNSNFSLALVSTLLGVIFAIIFKFFEGYLAGNYTLISERMTILTGDITKYILEKENRE